MGVRVHASPALAEAPLRRRRQFSPAQVLVLSFAALIASGALLLRLPIAAAREPLTFLDALFTATSAVCVTGLIVVDTPNDLTVFGQIVVLLLIQLGGLGYMAITTVVGLALGRQLSLHERLRLQEALYVQTMEGLARFVLTVLKLTLAFELTGALILTARWTGEYGIGQAAYYGLFHAISAFNNAGFALFSDSLMRYRGDWIVNLVITTLVVCGGLGFVVLTEIGRVRRFRRFSTHTHLVVTLTAALVIVTTAAIWFIEKDNPRTLQPLGISEALLASYFQAVTPRTAGFNTLDIGPKVQVSVLLDGRFGNDVANFTRRITELFGVDKVVEREITVPAPPDARRFSDIGLPEWDGYELIRDRGIPINPNNTQLYRELAWILFHKVGDFMDDVPPGSIIVIDNGGRPDNSCWGGLLSLAAKVKGIGGVVIDGACRDIDETREIGLPIYARGVVPMTARGRIMQESFNQEIQFAGVQVHPGDLVVADGSGVVIVPRSKEADVVQEAERIAAAESRMADGIRRGMSVVEVLETLGYESMLEKK